MPHGLFIVHVDCFVLPDQADAFAAATLINARASVNEPGILRFDVIADRADPTHFVLVEVYRDEDTAPAAHKQTAHYLAWRDTVAPMMARPRSSVKYVNLHPDAAGW
jgi:autoinducer 2-degrading protein